MKPLNLFSWINRRSYSQKFVAIGLLFALALTGFYPMSRDQLLRREQYGVKELEGTLYLRPLQQLLADVNEYYLLGMEADSGPAANSRREQKVAAIDASLAEANDWHEQYADSLRLGDELVTIEATWQDMQTAVAQGQPEAMQESYTLLNTQLLQLINRVGDTSFLILDPDLDTYYMMDASLLKLPELQNLLNQTAQIIMVAHLENELSASDRLQLIALDSQIQTILTKLQSGMATSWENDPTGQMRPLTEAPLQELTAQVQAYNSLINEQIIETSSRMIIQPDLMDMSGAVNEQLAKYYEGTSQALELGVNNRIDFYGSRLINALAIAATVIIAAMIIGFIQFRSISRPLQALTVAAQKLGAGDLNVRVNVKGEDEASRVGQVFNRMAADLQSTQQQLTEQVDELSKLTKSLDASVSISRQLATILDRQKLVSETIGQIQSLFNYNYVQFYLLDEAGDKLTLAAGTGQAGQELFARGHALAVGKGLVGQAAATNSPVLVEDVSQMETWVANPLLPNTQSELAVPVSVGDMVFGVLDVQDNHKEAFAEEDVALMQSVATAAALSLQNGRLYEQAQQSARHEGMLNQISQQVMAAPTMERVLQVAAQGLGSTLNVRRATVQLSRRADDGRFQEKN